LRSQIGRTYSDVADGAASVSDGQTADLAARLSVLDSEAYTFGLSGTPGRLA